MAIASEMRVDGGLAAIRSEDEVANVATGTAAGRRGAEQSTVPTGLDTTGGPGDHSNMRANERTSASQSRAPADGTCCIPCFKQELVSRLRAAMPGDEAIEGARAVFAALADRARLKILHALSVSEELCVCDVAHVLGMSVSAASHHLCKLRDLRIVKYRNHGKMAYYSLRDRVAAQLALQALHHTSA